MRDHAAAFDVIVSADTLVYFGDLGCVVAAAARALRPNGLFIFTLEHAVGAVADINWRLELHGRYSHARAYVERVSPPPDCSRGSLRPNCGWNRAHRWRDW